MRNKNRVELRGFLGDDPKLSTTETGRSRTTLSICTNYEYVNKAGETVSEPEWHRVVVWGKAAENAAKYLAKGSEAEIEGRIKTRQYESKGEVRYITEVVANEINYGRRPTKEAAPASTPAPQQMKAAGPVATPAVRAVARTTVRRRQTAGNPADNFVFEDGDGF
jgi:single-strand DNA-binding protein